MSKYAAYVLGGALFAAVLYPAAMVAMMALAPRTAEGGRMVVDMSWMLFATLPSVISGATGLTVGLFVPGGAKLRIAFVLGAAAAVFLATGYGIDLLRRDYIGKF